MPYKVKIIKDTIYFCQNTQTRIWALALVCFGSDKTMCFNHFSHLRSCWYVSHFNRSHIPDDLISHGKIMV